MLLAQSECGTLAEQRETLRTAQSFDTRGKMAQERHRARMFTNGTSQACTDDQAVRGEI